MIYIHLCQELGDVLYGKYGKYNCKAGAGGCCKHVAAAPSEKSHQNNANLAKSIVKSKV